MDDDFIMPPSEKRPVSSDPWGRLAAIAIATGLALITHHLDRPHNDIYRRASACTGKRSSPSPSSVSGRRRTDRLPRTSMMILAASRLTPSFLVGWTRLVSRMAGISPNRPCPAGWIDIRERRCPDHPPGSLRT